MKEGNYCLDSPVNTPDSNILTLNADLVWFDEDISHLLRDKETKQVQSLPFIQPAQPLIHAPATDF